MADDTFADFSQGTLSEPGVKVYVSAKGNVQLLDRLDLNGDGWLDLVFSNYAGTSHTINSYVYWGSAKGYSAGNKTQLPTVRGSKSMSADPGSVRDRGASQTFTSRIHDTKKATPTYETLGWTVKLPKNTSLKLQLRSAVSAAAIKSAAWRGPTSTSDHYVCSAAKTSAPVSKAHNGDRYIQYRAVLASDFGNAPVLDRVTITYR